VDPGHQSARQIRASRLKQQNLKLRSNIDTSACEQAFVVLPLGKYPTSSCHEREATRVVGKLETRGPQAAVPYALPNNAGRKSRTRGGRGQGPRSTPWVLRRRTNRMRRRNKRGYAFTSARAVHRVSQIHAASRLKTMLQCCE